MPVAKQAPADKAQAQKMIAELKVSGHLMTLDTGLFCIVQTPSRALDVATGLPGVRISMPPVHMGRQESVSISTFRPDGWLLGGGDAALVRVLNGPAQILVTIYQSAEAKEGAPNLQVLRLLEPMPGAVAARSHEAAAQAAPRGTPKVMEMVAHIQERGDVGAMLGEWLGERGSKKWIEGFGISPVQEITAAEDLEYQAVLGRGWLSPWVEGGQFCGSRGMALPMLGLRVRLRGKAAETLRGVLRGVVLRRHRGRAGRRWRAVRGRKPGADRGVPGGRPPQGRGAARRAEEGGKPAGRKAGAKKSAAAPKRR